MKRLRIYLANRLVWLALLIDPRNEEAMQFYMNRFTDFIISGRSNIKISVIEERELGKPQDNVEAK